MPPSADPISVPGPPLDPAALAAFRREGAAILAQERGLSATCRLRLAQAARLAGIAEERIEEAISSLGQAEPAAPPSAQEERFRQRLRKDLAAGSRAILGPTSEAKIFANAARKYGLDQQVAERVLCEVISELGVTRITAGDAIDSLAAQIDQAVGNSTWLAHEGWERLRSAATKWGMEVEVVDQMIDERLAANRAAAARRGFWTQATLYGAGGAVLATAVVVAGFVWSGAMRPGVVALPAGGAIERGTRRSGSTVDWWDVDLSVDVATARNRHQGQAEVLLAMSSGDAGVRASGYERLVAALREKGGDAELRGAMKPVLVGCLALERDGGAAERLRTAVVGLLPAVDAPLPADARALDVSLWGAEVMGQAMARRGITEDRKRELLVVLESAIGSLADVPEGDAKARQRGNRQVAILAVYRQLAGAAGKQAAEVAGIYRDLYERAAVAVDDERLMEAEAALLAAALPAAGAHWKAYERAMARCVASPDPLVALRLVDVLRRASEPALVEHLSKLLLVRSGAMPKSEAMKDVIAAVRKALGGTSGSFSLAERWEELAEKVEDARRWPAAKDRAGLLDQTVKLAHLTTLAVALSQGEAGMATFDRGIEHVPSLAADEAREASVAAASEGGSAGFALSRGEQRELAKAIEAFGKRGEAGRPERESGWRRVAAMGKETVDVPPGAAGQIAASALAVSDAAERVVVLNALAEVKHWKHLRLAIADAAATSKVARERLVEIVDAVSGERSPPDASGAALSRGLKARVLSELGSGAARVDDGLTGRAEGIFSDIYRERAGLLGVAPGSVSADDSPADLMEAMLRRMGPRGRGDNELDEWLKAARYVAGGELRYTVMLQRLLVERTGEWLAARRPERAAAVRRVAAAAGQQAAVADDVLVQLCGLERALLDVWMMGGVSGE